MGIACCEAAYTGYAKHAKNRLVGVVGELATQLRELRERSGLKQKEMAAKLRDKGLSMSDGYWNLLESGKRRIDFEVMLRAAEILGLELGMSSTDVMVLLSAPTTMDRTTKIDMEIEAYQKRLEELREERDRLVGRTCPGNVRG